MQLSVIIVNFNTPDFTCNCIRSLRDQIRIDLEYEIILVDNAPVNNDEALFRKLIPKLVYLRSEINVGFGVANNIGMEIAQGRYFLLLNSDTLIIDESIQRCISLLDSPQYDKVGLLGCKLLNED